MTYTEFRHKQAQSLAYARQHRIDPGSPCERCKADACPAFCKPKHDFERGRKRNV